MTAQSKRPNIVFIMADDHASKAISAYGQGINHTPNLDRIARDGMLFNHCYVTNSICTPSRATILTGQHNHVNQVYTLASKINNRMPNVAKQLRDWGKYQTAMIGKWHLGEGPDHCPEGSFDHWDVLPGQGEYFDPDFINRKGRYGMEGYATDIITDKSIDWMKQRDKDRPFFLMCHHKAPHRACEFHPKHANLYKDPIRVPENFEDDYKNRAKAAAAATMRMGYHLTYFDLGLVQPEGMTSSLGPRKNMGAAASGRGTDRWVPHEVSKCPLPLRDVNTAETFTFKTDNELLHFKYQRYMQRYLRTVQSIDEGVGRMLDYLEADGLMDNTIVIYTSDQGFFLGDHGWIDKRYMYEESYQMPFLIRGPGIAPGSICNDIVSNVDFAATWLDFAKLPIPSQMQGESFVDSLLQRRKQPQSEDTVAYHRYWMHRDSNTNTYAHYGVRDKRWKLIFWYNQGLGLPSTFDGSTEEQEWELFDCKEDPLEMFNIWSEDRQDLVPVRERMVRLLEEKMAKIGDSPAHPTGLKAEELKGMYVVGAGIAAKAGQRNN